MAVSSTSSASRPSPPWKWHSPARYNRTRSIASGGVERCRYTNIAARSAAIATKRSRSSVTRRTRHAPSAAARLSARSPRLPCSSRARGGTSTTTRPRLRADRLRRGLSLRAASPSLPNRSPGTASRRARPARLHLLRHRRPQPPAIRRSFSTGFRFDIAACAAPLRPSALFPGPLQI